MPHRPFSVPERDGPCESEAAAREEDRIFVSRALSPANVDEYLKVSVQNR